MIGTNANTNTNTITASNELFIALICDDVNLLSRTHNH